MLVCSLVVGAALATALFASPPASPNASSESAPEKHGELAINAKASKVYVIVRKDSGTLLSSAGHDHVIHATELSGSIAFDPAAPDRCKVEVTVPVAGLRVDEPEMQKHAGLEGKAISESTRREIEEDMRAEDQLDAKKYPKMTFRASGCSKASAKAESTVIVKGEITIHGKSRAIDVPMQFRFEGKSLLARGQFSLNHSDLGMKPYSAALGTLKNGELIAFHIEVKAEPASGASER